MIELQPFSIPPKYDEALYSIVRKIYKDSIFKPILLSVAGLERVKLNTVNQIITALQKGTIYYDRGSQGFKSTTNSFGTVLFNALESINASYMVRKKMFAIPFYLLPYEIQRIITSIEDESVQSQNEVIEAIDDIETESIEVPPSVNTLYTSLGTDFLNQFNVQYRDKAGNVPIIQKQLSESMQKVITQEYVQNLEREIKNFAQEEVIKIRQKTQDLALQGYRPKALEDLLIKEYNITKNKAKFIAKQEIGLFMSTMQQQEFTNYEVRKFRWHTSQDSRVRSSHRKLNKKIFTFDDLPVIDERTGQKGLPGQAFGCRCIMSPIFDI